jgi:branched-chain amino acid aminotransferase
MAIRGAVYVNGAIRPAAEAVIPVFDHGFVFGEGVYETIRTYNKVPFLLDRHIRRLRASAARLGLDVPFEDSDLSGWIAATMSEAGEMPEAYIRVLLTRGIGDLTYDLDATPRPSLVIIVKPLDESLARIDAEGIRMSIVPIIRNHPGSVNPIIKSNNLLNNAIAMQQAHQRGAFEALMCNYRGELCECSQSNFFLVRGGVVLTPPSEAGLLEGITRGVIFEIGQEERIEVREATLFPRDLETADEAFGTNTTREISPVVQVDDLTIGNGRPGPITLRLLQAYRQRAQAGTRVAAVE